MVVVLCCLVSTPVFPQSARIAEVARVIDGDTLTLTSGETIRLAGFSELEAFEKALSDDYHRFSNTKSLKVNLDYAEAFEPLTFLSSQG